MLVYMSRSSYNLQIRSICNKIRAGGRLAWPSRPLPAIGRKCPLRSHPLDALCREDEKSATRSVTGRRSELLAQVDQEAVVGIAIAAEQAAIFQPQRKILRCLYV